MVRKAYAYILRERQGQVEVLTFMHRDYPEAGVQVPKGGIEPGESPVEAATRETLEEVGVRGGQLLGEVARDVWTDPEGNAQERHIFAFRAPSDVADTWEHMVCSAGEDDGMVFVCAWLPIVDAPRALVPGHADYLERAAAFLRAGGEYSFSLVTPADVAQMAGWRYEGPYSIYSMGGDLEDPDEDPSEMLDRRSPSYAVRDAAGALVGFFVYGSAAEPWNHPVPTLYPNRARMLAIGLGMRPNLTGRGFGTAFVRAGLAFACAQFMPASLRLYVYPWNSRAIRVYEHAGFTATGTLSMGSAQGQRVFLEMRRPAAIDA